MTCPLRSTGITPDSRSYGAVRHWLGASGLSASRGFRLCLVPSHRQPGFQVPYRSQDWVHATSTPDTAWPPHGGHPALRSTARQWLQALAVSSFRLRARLDVSIPSAFFGQRGITPAFGHGAPHSSTRGTLTLLSSALLHAQYEHLRFPDSPGVETLVWFSSQEYCQATDTI